MVEQEKTLPDEEIKKSEDQPVGRRRAKEEQGRIEAARKKMCLNEESLMAIKADNAALDKHNEILLSSSGLGGCDSDIPKKLFSVLRKEALSKAKMRLQRAKQSMTNDQS